MRSYASAWKDYRCRHVVSKNAAIIIQQFAASHLADSLEELGNETGDPSERERAPVDTSWISLHLVHDILRGTTSVERSKLSIEEKSKASKDANQIEAAKSISERLWSIPHEHTAIDSSLDKQGSIVEQHSAASTSIDDGKHPEDPSSSRKDANLVYKTFRSNKVKQWLRELQADNNEITPSAEQLQFIKTVVSRCVQGAREEHSNVEYRSEPLRLILHGVPGA